MKKEILSLTSITESVFTRIVVVIFCQKPERVKYALEIMKECLRKLDEYEPKEATKEVNVNLN